MNKKLPTIVAVDFDGTLVEDNFPEIGQPIPIMIEYIKSLSKAGAKIILWTCRNGKALEQALQFCTDYKLYFDAVNENLPEVKELYGGDTRKVFADFYIDDKAYEASKYLLSMEADLRKFYAEEAATALPKLLATLSNPFESEGA